MKDITKDDDFMTKAKQCLPGKMYKGRGHTRYYPEADGEEYYPFYLGSDGNINNPLVMIEIVEALKDRRGGDGTLSKITESPTLVELI